MTYELIDHTADIGIRVTAPDIPALFEQTALSLFDLITDMNILKGHEIITIHVDGDDWPDLMVNWLREVLYLWTGKEILIKNAEIISICKYKIKARLLCENFNAKYHEIIHEIKAVTYHGIEVIPCTSGWQTTVIFDT